MATVGRRARAHASTPRSRPRRLRSAPGATAKSRSDRSSTTLVDASSTSRPAWRARSTATTGPRYARVGGAAAELAGDDRHLDARGQRAVVLARDRGARTSPNDATASARRSRRLVSSRSSTVFGPRSATSDAALRCSSSCSSEYRVSIAYAFSALAVLLRPRRGAGPQRLLLDLARRVHRQLVDELDRTRHLVVGHRLARPRDELVGIERRARRGHDERHAHLAQPRRRACRRRPRARPRDARAAGSRSRPGRR